MACIISNCLSRELLCHGWKQWLRVTSPLHRYLTVKNVVKLAMAAIPYKQPICFSSYDPWELAVQSVVSIPCPMDVGGSQES